MYWCNKEAVVIRELLLPVLRYIQDRYCMYNGITPIELCAVKTRDLQCPGLF